MKLKTVACGLLVSFFTLNVQVHGYGKGKKTKCFSIPSFPSKVEKVIRACQDEVKSNLIEDLLFAAVYENPFEQSKHQHVLKEFEDHLFHYNDGSHHSHQGHSLGSLEHHHGNEHHHGSAHQHPINHHGHLIDHHTHPIEHHHLDPHHHGVDAHHHVAVPQHHIDHQNHQPDPHQIIHHPSDHQTHAIIPHNPTDHHHHININPHHLPIETHHVAQTFPHLQPEIKHHDTSHHLTLPIVAKKHYEHNIEEAHEALTKVLAAKPVDPHDNHHHISAILEKLRSGDNDETDNSNLKWHRRISKRSLFGKWTTKMEDDDAYHPTVLTHEDRWLAGCLMQCVFRKNDAVDKHGYPTLDGLTDLYTAGTNEQAFFVHVLRSVDKCLKSASVKHKIYKGKTPIKGETCDVAFDVFDCVSDSVTEYCS